MDAKDAVLIEAQMDEKTKTIDSWATRREAVVKQALLDEDHETLQRVAGLPGGFGTNELRKQVWPVLLHTQRFFPSSSNARDQTGEESERSVILDGRHAGPAHESEGELDFSTTSPTRPQAQDQLAPHPDEEQVLRDTKRSFVTYPRDLHPQTKQTMQEELQSLIAGVLRLYPTLSYFQGYHDIMSVLYLTFLPIPPAPAPRSRSSSTRQNRSRRTSHLKGDLTPMSGAESPVLDGSSGDTSLENPDDVDQWSDTTRCGRGRSVATLGRPVDVKDARRTQTAEWTQMLHCAQVVSLLRIRDAMSHGLEPMMGLLKLLQRLLKVADPELARFSSAISPVPTLPFFALSWILCLFSHDVDDLEPIQRMFDYLLSRNPIAAIYLAVAILIAKKDQMFRLAKELGAEVQADPSLLHPLFSRLPPLFADTPDADDQPSQRAQRDGKDDANPYDPIPLSRIFRITDDLLARYPWDGEVMRGHEVLGPASVVSTYEREWSSESCGDDQQWTLAEAEGMVKGEIVRPGATEPDEPEPEPRARPPRRTTAIKQNRIGTVVAVGAVVLGVGLAIYGSRSGGSGAGWAGWWARVIHSVAQKSRGESLRAWHTVVLHARKILAEVV